MNIRDCYLMEFNPQQGLFHYNERVGSGFHHEPNTHGWCPLVVIDDEAAGSDEFTDRTHRFLKTIKSAESMRDAVIAVLLDLGLPFLKWTV